MRRSLLLALAVIVLASLTLATLLLPAPAEAGRLQVKFFVTEYRLKLGDPHDGTEALPMTLEFRGKASLHGGDKVDFRWMVEDATPYLPLLSSCGTGRLHGAAALANEGTDRLIEGRGPLAELSCRMILK